MFFATKSRVQTIQCLLGIALSIVVGPFPIFADNSKPVSPFTLLVESGTSIKRLPIEEFPFEPLGVAPYQFTVIDDADSITVNDNHEVAQEKTRIEEGDGGTSLTAGILYSTSYLSILSANGIQNRLKIFVADSGAIGRLSHFPEVYGDNTVKLLGDTFAIVDEAAIIQYFSRLPVNEDGPIEESTFGMLDDDSGVGSLISENGTVSYPNAGCFRPYVPYTRQGSGIVHWLTGLLPRVLHTLKDENSGTNSSSSLRCPRRTQPSTDYYIDGIYSVTWASSASTRAMKVPDHCSVTKNILGYATCCNAAASIIMGRVSMINPRLSNLSDWPDLPRVCTMTER